MTSMSNSQHDLRKGSKIEGLELAILGRSSGFWLPALFGTLYTKLYRAIPVSGCIYYIADKISMARHDSGLPMTALSRVEFMRLVLRG